MNTSKGFWESASGTRMTIEVRQAGGTTKNVSVSRKWYEDLLRQGKISDSASTTVTVSMVRSMSGEEEVCA